MGKISSTLQALGNCCGTKPSTASVPGADAETLTAPRPNARAAAAHALRASAPSALGRPRSAPQAATAAGPGTTQPAVRAQSVADMENRSSIDPHVDLLLPAAQRQFPRILAVGRRSVVVAGPDGKVRRFPQDSGTSAGLVRNGLGEGGHCSVGRSLMRDKAMMHDTHKHAVLQAGTGAGYVFDAQAGTLTYQAAGKSVQSINPHFDVFPLEGGKWMVPQPELRDATYACTEMLLAEGKPAAEVLAQMKDFKVEGERAGIEETVQALRERSDREVLLVQEQRTAGESVQRLHDLIAQNGPCVLSIQGHVRMLDAIALTPRGAEFSIRDPFTGSSLRCVDHEQFWNMTTNLPENRKPPLGPTDSQAVRTWAAIFLKPKQPSAPAESVGSRASVE